MNSKETANIAIDALITCIQLLDILMFACIVIAVVAVAVDFDSSRLVTKKNYNKLKK